MATLGVPEPKRHKTMSASTTSSTSANAHLLYFGLTFMWMELALDEPCNCLTFSEIPQDMATVIIDDVKKLKKGNFLQHAGKGVFRRVDNTNVFIFQHTTHSSCSSVTFDKFECALPVIKRTSCGHNECLEAELSHEYLDPFFYDNVSLFRKWEVKHSQSQLLSRLKYGLQDPENVATPDEFSTGGAPFDAKGCIFSQDIWSMRLGGCLKMYLSQNFQVAVTCKLGITFKLHQTVYTGVPTDLCQCYLFRGSPDLTIKHYPIILDTEDTSDKSPESGSEPESVIENSLQVPKQLSNPPKLGELLSNMHIQLVMKLLRKFVKKGQTKDVNLTCRGLFLHKSIGGIICEINVDLMKNKPAPLNISVDDFACSFLSPSSLCHNLQRLLQSSLHPRVDSLTHE